MDFWETENFADINGYNPDSVVCLKFPCYYLHHSNKVVWLLHQHRSVYDLLQDQKECPSPELLALRERIIEKDTTHLSRAGKVYANSRNVGDRLKRFNGIDATPLYHPPALADHLYSRDAEPYIFFPSRIEALKRQQLLIEAMRFVQSPVGALIAGDGGQRPVCEKLIQDLGLCDRVRLLGHVSERELLAYYACCLGVFFGPHDEDYGYVTLEAMLARKPVITCTDSGGPLEFVDHEQTGFIVEPEARSIGAAIDRLYERRNEAANMGRAGYLKYKSMGISWDTVVNALIGEASNESA
ncbi:MAG: glycosyltransferase family 4 protein [Bryobacteraceae bacterium]